MALLHFEDYPSTKTPINAENINNNFKEVNIENGEKDGWWYIIFPNKFIFCGLIEDFKINVNTSSSMGNGIYRDYTTGTVVPPFDMTVYNFAPMLNGVSKAIWLGQISVSGEKVCHFDIISTVSSETQCSLRTICFGKLN